MIAKINDPVRAAAYAELGIGTICRTGLMVDTMNAHLGFPASGLAGMLAPSGHHPGGQHHHEEGASPSDASEARAASEPGPATAGPDKEA